MIQLLKFQQKYHIFKLAFSDLICHEIQVFETFIFCSNKQNNI